MLKLLLIAAALVLMGGSALAQDSSLIHRVTYGDTLFSIAQRYGVTIDEIAAANNIVYTWNIKVGQELVIPGQSAAPSSTGAEDSLGAAAPVQHVIRRGETLATIAAQYGVTTDLILRANNIANPNLIYYGQTLNIWTPNTVDSGAYAGGSAAAQPVVSADTLRHTVRAGETLGTIARLYGVSLSELIAANALSNPNLVYVGSQIAIPGRTGVATSTSDPAALASYNGAQPTIYEGKQIVVDLSEQRVYAFDNGTMVFTALGSTGLPATPTVLGDYAIYVKLESTTMSGPGYYLPGVQWTQYFFEGYGLHGTYWHNNFGQPMSHGCVNLTNADAYWLFNWASVGTPVHVRA